MKQYIDTVTDELSNLPIPDAEVYIYDDDGALALLYASDGETEVGNPLTTNAQGEYSFYQNVSEFTAVVYYGGRLRRRLRLLVGGGYSAAAASSAQAALAAAGVGEYDNTTEGLAATTLNETFWVDQGDGTGMVYRHDAGPVATALRPFILDPTSAGAATVFAGGIPRNATLAASGGAALVGFLQTGTGAVARTAQAKARDVVSVKDFGAVGDGVTNDRTAIQAAFSSGAKRVMFPSGVYIVTGGGLTVPDWLAVIGEGYGPTSVPGDAGVLIKFSLTSGIALDCGFNPTFDNIYFTNIGGSYDEGTATLSGTTASCIALTDNLTMNYCSFAGWNDCIKFGPSTFYVKTFGVEFNRCTNGYRTDGTAPYNIDIYAPISRLTTNFFAGQSVYPARNIKVHGGSIEGYSSVAFGFLDASFFGTYFETISQRAGAIALAPEVNGSAITLVGCLIYMNYTARFANLSGLTNAMLTSVGNQYDGAAPAAAICLYLPTSGSVNLSGDRFGTGHPNDAIYVDSIPAAAQFNGITFPVLPSGNSQAAYSGMALVGSRGFISFGLAAEPSAKTTGMTVMADGDSWDPLTRAAGRPYWTIWQGDRWYGLSGEA